MKTVVNKYTGEVLYCFFESAYLTDDETVIDEVATGNFYDFKTMTFFDKE